MAWVNAIIQGLLTGGLYALFACGLSLMFGVMKVVNLAHGDLATVAGYIAVGIIAISRVPVLWSIPIVVVLMAVLGYILQRSIIQAAITRGEPGVYNIVDDDPAPVAEWLPYLAECLGAKRPAHVPVWLGRLIAGEVIVAQMTQVRGSSNAKARRELGWTPGYSSWRDGFPVWAAGVRGAGSPRMGAAGVRGAGSPRWRKSA